MSGRNKEKAREYEYRRYHENKEARLADHREWRRKNPEKMRAYRARNKARAANLARQQRYEISPTDFARMLLRQGGRCAICNATEPGGAGGWHVDHDHSFPKTDPKGHRGLLCSSCNRALGLFKDRIGIVRAAVDYLEDFAIARMRQAHSDRNDVRREMAVQQFNQETA